MGLQEQLPGSLHSTLLLPDSPSQAAATDMVAVVVNAATVAAAEAGAAALPVQSVRASNTSPFPDDIPHISSGTK